MAPPSLLRSILLFAVAALAELGGAWLAWQGAREHRGLVFVGAGILALGLYGFAATFQPDPTSAASWPPTMACSWRGPLTWGVLADGFRPDRNDPLGATPCLAGAGVIRYMPRAS